MGNPPTTCLTRLTAHPDATEGLARLGRALEEPRRGVRLHRFVQPVPALDAARWLASRPGTPRVFWRGADAGFLLAGVGVAAGEAGQEPRDAARLLRDLAVGEAHDTLRVIAWGRAQPAGASAEWAAFGAVHALVPLVEYREERGQASLCVNLCPADHDPHGRWLAAQVRRAQAILAAPDAGPVPARARARPEGEHPERATHELRIAQGSILARRRGVRRFSLPRTRRYRLAEATPPAAWLLGAGAGPPRALLEVAPGQALVLTGPACVYRRRADEVEAEVRSGARRGGATAAARARTADALVESPERLLEHELLCLELGARLRGLCHGAAVRRGPRIDHHGAVLELCSTLRGDLDPGTCDGPLLARLAAPAAAWGLPLAEAFELGQGLDATDPGLLGGLVACLGRRESEVALIVPALAQRGAEVQISVPCPVTEGVSAAAAWEDSGALLDSLEADLGLAACDPSATNPTSAASGAA